MVIVAGLADEQAGKRRIPRGLKTKVQDEVITERIEAALKNRDLVTDRTKRLDLSDIFYDTRSRLDAMGYDVDGLSKSRKNMNAHVKEFCDKYEWVDKEGKKQVGIKRHDVGIFAADRAVLAFQGESYSVSFENYKGLAEFGTDIICTEKEGFVEKLVSYTTGYGIGLVQSEGFVSEFGEMLAQLAKEKGANVVFVTDFDVSGIGLAFELEGITRIGIDFTTIDELNEQNPGLNLEIAKVRERYKGGNHWKALDNLVRGRKRPRGSRKYIPIKRTEHELKYIEYLKQKRKITTVNADGTKTTTEVSYLEYLKNRRIELNSVMREVGPARFWKWLKQKMFEKFPNRDFNRAIDVPEFILTPTMSRFQEKLQQSITNDLQTTVDATRLNLTKTKGFHKKNTKLQKIQQEFILEVLKKSKYRVIDSSLNFLLKSELKDDEFETED